MKQIKLKRKRKILFENKPNWRMLPSMSRSNNVFKTPQRVPFASFSTCLFYCQNANYSCIGEMIHLVTWSSLDSFSRESKAASDLCKCKLAL